MPFENPVNNIPPISDEDLAAARQLIEEDPRLNNHPLVQQLLKDEFIREGRQIDAGNFLSAVLQSLEGRSDVSEEEINSTIEDAMVVHSRPTR